MNRKNTATLFALGALLALVARPFTALSDSEAKKDLRVKLKRYAEGLRHPADLGPTRWRLHSSAAEAEARARAGVGLAMTAGSAVVSRDSPTSFNNILAYRDEVVPWIRRLTDACHDHGCAVMIQLTHLGRRTGWSYGDWLPSVSSAAQS